jgi:hypothetical protein
MYLLQSGNSGRSVIDFCSRCGVGVWGEKMFQAILKNMEQARDKATYITIILKKLPHQKLN